ncbi:MAG TPA: hypothetical protein VK506_06845, partial [Conexibacter sp.]|nr:hypothetical protein [Conexibacter sp.]
PDVGGLPQIDAAFAAAPPPGEAFLPYARDARGVRPWAPPGTPGLAHRIGGLEKQDGTGNISYDAANHATMTRLRAEKVAAVRREVPDLLVDADEGAELLVLGWGSTSGAIRAAARRVRDRGLKVAIAHLRHIDPLPANVGELLRAFPRVLVPELNSGQLAQLLRGRFLVDVRSHTKISGQPLFAAELEQAIVEEAGRSPAVHGRLEVDSRHQDAGPDAPRR